MNVWTRRRLTEDGALAAGAFAGMLATARPQAAAALLDLSVWPWANRLFYLGLFVAFGALIVLGGRLSCRVVRSVRTRRLCEDHLVHGATAGTVMVEFALVFPIVLTIMGTIFQLALLANASLIVRYAAFSAARTGIVSVQYEHFYSFTENLTYEPEKITASAYLILAGISPAGADGGGADDAAKQVAVKAAEAIQAISERQAGPWGSRTYRQRVNYAAAATEVKFSAIYPSLIPDDDELVPPPLRGGGGKVKTVTSVIRRVLPTSNIFSPSQVEVTVDYKFLITIPGLMSLLPGDITSKAPGGVSGNAFTISQTVRLQSTGSRESNPIALLAVPWRMAIDWAHSKLK